ncbi:thiolase family protein [Aureibacter tunicatorum]|uniref:acetyl-CoA C-acyltransferase n=1 Tax=Aureibacter tunicatorum TaxID=866807 RepID=A0AAE3XJ91_9BACT|nr:acetyl-CoA C-acyltransferase [Aureibacter tunicatorum]MDR6237753.1 acetyl-CoA acyltransferase [Aureibacter tunicatorum]BDD02788.1 acetyl-CoA acetyltransferase [Aureibacter tunicatorum]
MDAYIVKGYRTAVAKAKKGALKSVRPDDFAADVIKHLVGSVNSLDVNEIDDLIVGNAVPEAEQGMQMGRIISLLSLSKEVPGFLVNRYCGSGLEALYIGASRIHAGMANCIIAGGTESMTMVPMLGYKTALNYKLSSQFPDYYSSMGITAEQVAKEYGISRQAQDEFAFHSHQKAIRAIDEGRFKDEIVPLNIEEIYLDANEKRQVRSSVFDTDEGPRRDTSLEALAKLKPVFANGGSVTAGNSSQTSDGAAFLMIMSEKTLKKHNLEPIAQMKSFAAAGVEPRIMGIGPVKSIPKALELSNLALQDIDQIELNEAFAAQVLAVTKELNLNPQKVNVNGGAIALGHPLGCSGAKLSVQLIHEMKKRQQKYGMVTACVGGGQGVSAIFEVF